jgi:hypothetical protein
MINKSSAFIEDEIAMRLDDYRWALKKHGLKALIGSISGVFDSKFLMGSTTVAAGLTFITSQPIWGLLAQAGMLIGKTAIRLSTMLLDIEEAKKGKGYEISYVYEAKKKLKPS